MVNTKDFENYIGKGGKAYFKKQNPTKQVKKVVKGTSDVKLLKDPKFVQPSKAVASESIVPASKEEIKPKEEAKPPVETQKKIEKVKPEGSSSSRKPVTYGTNLLTTEQVKDIQRASGGVLKVDGIVGPKTKAYAQQINMPLTKEEFNAQPKVGEQVVVPSTEIPYTGKYSNMENAALFNNLPSNATYMKSADVKKQMNIPVEPGLASSTQFNANDFKRFDDIRALQADQGMSELEAMARYGQSVRPNASGLADAVTPNKAPVTVPAPAPVPVTATNVVTPTNKVNPNANEIARLNAAVNTGIQAVDAQNYMKAATGK